MNDRLVEEKGEGKDTVAKAGAFWALLAVPLLLWRRRRKQAQRRRGIFRRR